MRRKLSLGKILHIAKTIRYIIRETERRAMSGAVDLSQVSSILKISSKYKKLYRPN